MADTDALLQSTNETTVLGNSISLKMVTFLDQAKDQPAGFRGLGLDFLGICQILNALEESLKEHFETKQPFPRQAVPELTKVLSKTFEDLKHLQSLLQKFMDYERGGAFAKLQKTWQLVFADRGIARVRSSLQANKGALTMALLLTNINPNIAPVGYEYGMLAAKLQDTPPTTSLASTSPQSYPAISELQGSQPPQELPGSVFRDTSIYTSPSSTPIEESDTQSSNTTPEDVTTPSISEMSISERAPEPSIVLSIETYDQEPQSAPQEANPVDDSIINVVPVEINPGSPVDQGPLPIIHVDRSKFNFRKPTQTSGAGNASLQKALASAVVAQKRKIVEQLLDCGVSPNTAPESCILGGATQRGDLVTLNLLLEFGADPNIPAKNGDLPIRTACQYKRHAEANLLLEYGANPNLCSPDMTALPWALRENDEKIIVSLLQYGADPNLEMPNGTTSLLFACERPNISPKFVQELLRYGAKPNVKNRHGQTALNAACYQNCPDIVEILLSQADPNLKGTTFPIEAAVRHPTCLSLLISAGADLSKRKGIMEMAVVYNSIESVKVLLDAGVDPNEKSDGIFSPITTAIRENRPEILALLLSRGADPNMKGQEMPLALATSKPPLLKQLLAGGADLGKCVGVMESAVFRNCIESVEILLDAGVNPNDKNQGIFSPITTAIRDNRPDILSLLLSRGADPNLKGQEMPLIMATARVEILKQLVEGGADLAKCPGVMEAAVFKNNIASVTYLFDLGVNPNDKNQGIYTPLTTAIRDNRPEILALLLKRGVDPNLRGQNVPLIQATSRPALLKQLLAGGADVKLYKGLIEDAVCKNNIESIDILLEAGCDINELHHEAYSPLTTAIRDNRIEIIKQLFEKGADPNAKGQGLPIVLAAQFKDGNRLRMVIEAGADVDGKDREKTALIEAVERGFVDNVRLLLEKGADVSLVDGQGRSAMDVAATKGFEELVEVLLEKMI